MLILIAAVLPALATSNAAPADAIKLPPPGVQYRVNVASASRRPWVDANGWRMERAPDRTYFYEVSDRAAALACAEAYAWAVKALVHTTESGTAAFQSMLEFVKSLPEASWPVMANIGVVDDGSNETGELMNLLARRNLLYRIVPAPDPKLDLNVRVGSAEYPKTEAANPALLAQKIRSQLGDDKRLVRLYGSEVVIARLVGNGQRARLHLVNYASRPVNGLRVRIRGKWTRQEPRGYSDPQLKLRDVSVENDATEFTIPEMGAYVAVDLAR
jgi:hypothetical protein